jgi:DNA-binding IscR family transcriptional regulator
MQITRQADYALRAMLYLAQLSPNMRAATSHIAEEQSIPPSFLAKIITVLEVVEAIDGPISLNECCADPQACVFGEKCPLRPLWCDTQSELVNRLKNTTFDQFVVSQAVS